MHLRTRLLFLSSLAVGLSAYACGNPRNVGSDEDSEGKAGLLPLEEACREFSEAAGWQAGEPVATTAEASAERIVAVGDATWPLAVDLLKAVPPAEHTNIAHSPTSFYAALGMAYDRWKDSPCGQEIAHAMRFPETGDSIHHAIGAGIRALGQRALPGSENTSPVVLNLTRSIWLFGDALPQAGELGHIYGATPHVLRDKGEASRQLVNCVIEEQSMGLLPDFLSKGKINVDTTSLDINVTYLKAPWLRAFTETEVDFTPEDGTALRVPGLSSSELSTSYYDGSTFEALHLPLRGRQLKVLVVLPKVREKSLDEFVREVSAEELSAARDTTFADTFEFRMPKVDIKSQTISYPERLGIECDYSLQGILHGAGVTMDESGLEAAAATVVIGGDDGDFFVPPSRQFFVDRPFVFFVFDAETRFVLFSGRVLELG